MQPHELSSGGACDITRYACAPKASLENPLLRWRREFSDTMRQFKIGLTVEGDDGEYRWELSGPDADAVGSFFTGSIRALRQRHGNQILFPVSGDTDSAALVSAIATAIRSSDDASDVHIRAFHLKDHDPARIHRLHALFSSINRSAGRELITMDIFDMSRTEAAFAEDIRASIHLGKNDSDFRRKIILEHHLIDAIAGNLCSYYGTSFLCKGQTFTEIASNDYPMPDMRAVWHPGLYLPKTCLTRLFDEELKTFDDPELTTLWYPVNHRKLGERHIYQKGISMEWMEDQQTIHLIRPHWKYIPEFSDVYINAHNLTLGPESMKNIADRIGNSGEVFSIDQKTLPQLDPFFYLYMDMGLSESNAVLHTQDLLSNQRSDALLAGVLMANARDHYTKTTDMLRLMAKN